jgi:hypothetical protein
MTTSTLAVTRRCFAKQLSIGAALLVATPSFMSSKTFVNILHIGLVGEPDRHVQQLQNTLSDLPSADWSKTFSPTHPSLDLVYFTDHTCSIYDIHRAVQRSKHLMVTRLLFPLGTETESDLIERCQKVGVALAIVQPSSEALLFERIDFYETNLNESLPIQKVLHFLTILSSLTHLNGLIIHQSK